MPAKVTNEDLDRFWQQFYRSVDYFEREFERLFQEYPGQFIAILDEKMIDHDRDEEVVALRVRDSYPDRYVLIVRAVPRISELIDV